MLAAEKSYTFLQLQALSTSICLYHITTFKS